MAEWMYLPLQLAQLVQWVSTMIFAHKKALSNSAKNSLRESSFCSVSDTSRYAPTHLPRTPPSLLIGHSHGSSSSFERGLCDQSPQGHLLWWKMEEALFPDEENRQWWVRMTLGAADAKCPSPMCCACFGWRNLKDGTVLEACKMAGDQYTTQTHKWWHWHCSWNSLSLNLDGWISHQMLPFARLPETPSLFISFHLGKQYPSAHGWGDYKVMKSIPQIIDENHRHGFLIIPDT